MEDEQKLRFKFFNKRVCKAFRGDKVTRAYEIASQRNSDGCLMDAELQLDAALISRRRKRRQVPLLVRQMFSFSDLNAGNIGYKLVQRIAKAQAMVNNSRA